MLDQVPLTWRPTFGTGYVASPLTSVRYGSSIRQYGLVTDIELPFVDPAIELFANPVAPAPYSGITARTAHASWSRRPVLVPPCTVRPLRSRATTFTSTPCQFSVIFAKFVDEVASSSTCPTFVGTRL